ncbi:MAG: tetrahydrofolate dehydrogenase/cyclohydrolase catalytic domain-containing protein, partial [Sporomusa sp.]
MGEKLAGKTVADAMKEELSQKIAAIKAKGITPQLGIIRVGARPDDLFYENGAKKTCEAIGMAYQVFEYPADVDQAAFEQAVKQVGANKDINGILMFAPLPKQLDEKKIRNLIPVEKDVDCMAIGSAAKVYTDDPTGFPPCTPTACMDILKFYN